MFPFKGFPPGVSPEQPTPVSEGENEINTGQEGVGNDEEEITQESEDNLGPREEGPEPFDAENEKLVRRLQKAETLEDVKAIMKTFDRVIMRNGQAIPGEDAAKSVEKGDYHDLTEELERIIGAIGNEEFYTLREKGYIERKPLAWKEGDRFRSRNSGREFEIVELYTREKTPYEGYAVIEFARDPKADKPEMVRESVPFSKLNKLLDRIEPVRLGGRDLKKEPPKDTDEEELLGKYQPPEPGKEPVVKRSKRGIVTRLKSFFGKK